MAVMSKFTQVLRCYVRSAAFIVFHNVFVGVCDILPLISLENKAGMARYHHRDNIRRWIRAHLMFSASASLYWLA